MLLQLLNPERMHVLPGRLRMTVPGLRGNKEFSAYLTKKLRETDYIIQASANELTGRVLIFYVDGSATVPRIQQLLQSLHRKFACQYNKEQHGTAVSAEVTEAILNIQGQRQPADGNGVRLQLMNTVLTGGVLAGLLLKRLLVGRSVRSASTGLFNIAAVITIIAGYPSLRQCSARISGNKGLNHDLLLTAASLVLLIMRESITGLSVLWLVQLSNLFSCLMQNRSRQAAAAILRCGQGGSAAANLLPTAKAGEPAQAPGGNQAGQNYSRLAAWTAGIAVAAFLITGDYRRSIAVLLAGCPAVTALSSSAAFGLAEAKAVRQKILLKDRQSLETAGEVDTVIFDNTGILTADQPQISETISLADDFATEQILMLAAAAQEPVKDPVARMLCLAAEKAGGLPAPDVQERIVVPGQGVKGIAGRDRVLVGSAQFMESESVGMRSVQSRVLRLKHLGSQVLYVAINGKLAGLIGVRQELKPESRLAVEAVRAAGVSDIRVFSDAADRGADPVIRELGLTPIAGTDKRRSIAELQQTGRRVAIVGAGSGDWTVLADADSKIALNLPGSRAPVSAADVLICGDDLGKFPELLELSRRAGQIVRQNLAFSAGGSAAGIALAAAGLLSPLAAALFLNLSTLGVILNSARLLDTVRSRQEQASLAAASCLDLQRFSHTVFTAGQPSIPDKPSGLSADWRDRNEAGLKGGWHQLTAEMVCQRLQSALHTGLPEQTAVSRGKQIGLNVLAEAPKPSFWQLFREQFKDFMVRVLLGATGISFLLGEVKDALLSAGIVVVNAVLGAYQESKAGQSLEAMKKMTAPLARVIRSGRIQCVKAQCLVPGDLLILEAGDRVPADARLIKSTQFEVEEASLTGETLPVRKNSIYTGAADTALGDRKNMVFMGTSVTRGRAQAMVVATGMRTELGKIAALLQQQKAVPTPLQRRLEELSKAIVFGCLSMAGVIFLIGILQGQKFLQMIRLAATMAVTAIPEGLSAIVIVALALGVRRMVKQNILVRNMASIETLGCATVICSDKTGTLTKNEMTVRKIYTADGLYTVTGEGYAPQGCFQQGEASVAPAGSACLMQTLLTGALCNNARLNSGALLCQERVVDIQAAKSREWRIDGDPTEGALLVAAAKAGLWERDLQRSYQRTDEIPFESERRMMSVVYTGHDKLQTLYCKGAPDSILQACTQYLDDGEIKPLTPGLYRKLQAVSGKMAAEALRVLATAYRCLDGDEDGNLEHGLIFCGFIGMIDPPRPEVLPAIAKCRQAGVKVVMITGDHPNTAQAIALELGLLKRGQKVITGPELETMSDKQLAAVVETASVYARTAPQHKLRIIRAFQQKGYIVAMTGDGANDAPAVKAADIGIAMGITGTAVTKEAACLTLADDNFATIVNAMQEGRSIYANIRKAVRYALATNTGEVVLMILVSLMGLPMPLLPIQLLWINLIGDGLPVIALVNDPPARGIMRQPPRKAGDSLFAGGLGWKIISRGIIIGVAALGLYTWKLAAGAALRLARTMVIAQIAVSQFVHIFDCRLESREARLGPLSNWPLVGAVALSMVMVGAIIYLPVLQAIFGTTGLSTGDWLLVGAASAGTALVDAAVGRMLSRKLPRLSTTNAVEAPV